MNNKILKKVFNYIKPGMVLYDYLNSPINNIKDIKIEYKSISDLDYLNHKVKTLDLKFSKIIEKLSKSLENNFKNDLLTEKQVIENKLELLKVNKSVENIDKTKLKYINEKINEIENRINKLSEIYKQRYLIKEISIKEELIKEIKIQIRNTHLKILALKRRKDSEYFKEDIKELEDKIKQYREYVNKISKEINNKKNELKKFNKSNLDKELNKTKKKTKNSIVNKNNKTIKNKDNKKKSKKNKVNVKTNNKKKVKNKRNSRKDYNNIKNLKNKLKAQIKASDCRELIYNEVIKKKGNKTKIKKRLRVKKK